jgi:hypothetical protein
LTGTRLLQLYQQKAPPITTPSHNSLPLTVTDTDVRLQEQRVQLLRQQLMAAQNSI